MINKTSGLKLSPVDIESRKKLNFKSGDTVSVLVKILDEKSSKKENSKQGGKDKFRLQAFEGIVLARKHGTEIGATFMVRKVASGVGVERIFPLFSPMIEKIEIKKKSRSRRSKIYYVRNKAVKDIRKKMRSVAYQEDKKEEIKEKSPADEPQVEETLVEETKA